MKKYLFFLIASTFLITGCYNDSEEELYGLCDTSQVSYSGTIRPLLTAYGCVSCHSGTAPSGNINLTTYIAVQSQVTNGRLYGSVSHATGFVPMPQGGARMTDCDLKKLRAWITAGAPNN